MSSLHIETIMWKKRGKWEKVSDVVDWKEWQSFIWVLHEHTHHKILKIARVEGDAVNAHRVDHIDVVTQKWLNAFKDFFSVYNWMRDNYVTRGHLKLTDHFT